MKNEEKKDQILAQSEYPEVLAQDSDVAAFWESNQVYKCKNQADFSKLYSIDTPPPTVSGKLHIGHVFSYTQADLLARYNRMLGKDVFYPMGFDDNGLATEKFVAKRRQITPSKTPRPELIKMWHEETALARDEFKALWTSLGISFDWSLVYSTISPEVQRVSQTAFVRLYEKGLVEHRVEPYMFCTTCQTSVAQAELDWQDKKSEFFKFFVDAPDKSFSLPIATTRPELLFSCVAIMVNPEDSRYNSFVGQTVVMPISGKSVKIIADGAVSIEKGTGAVMCCTFGDQTDVAWYKKYSLDLIQTIDRNGKMMDNTPLVGLTVAQAREAVGKLLQESGKFDSRWKIDSGAHVHERCGQPIEFLIVKQWFIKIVENKKIFLELADKILWRPEHMKSRYIDWVENLSWDWCISRQRYFGIAIPAYHCQDCLKTFLPSEAELPVSPIEDVKSKICKFCKSTNLLPETDVADTWVTSGLTPLLLQGWPENDNFIPMTMRPCAHDIIRTWAFYTIVMTYYNAQTIPWNELNISGHVLAGRGEKISKSKENAQTSPPELIAQYSADAIRYWTASGKLGVDTVFELEQIKNGRRTVTKLINALKFGFGYIPKGLDLDTNGIENKLRTDVSRWLLASLKACQRSYHKAFAQNDYSGALEIIERFFWSTFCDNYIELVKIKFFDPVLWANDIESARLIMKYSCKEILKMYAPFLPFTTQKLFSQYYSSSQAIALEKFDLNSFDPEFATRVDENIKRVEHLVSAVSMVRRIKSEAKVSLKAPILGLAIRFQSTIPENFREERLLIGSFSKAPEDGSVFLLNHDDQLPDVFAGKQPVCSSVNGLEVYIWF